MPKIEMDETMREIRKLARQIRDKKIIMRQERAILKNSTKPVVPRTAPAKVRDRSASRLRSEMEELGVDMSDTSDVSIGSSWFNVQWQDLISQLYEVVTNSHCSVDSIVIRHGLDEQGIVVLFPSVATNYSLFQRHMLRNSFWLQCLHGTWVADGTSQTSISHHSRLSISLNMAQTKLVPGVCSSEGDSCLHASIC